jgi:hypothetical protein
MCALRERQSWRAAGRLSWRSRRKSCVWLSRTLAPHCRRLTSDASHRPGKKSGVRQSPSKPSAFCMSLAAMCRNHACWAAAKNSKTGPAQSRGVDSRGDAPVSAAIVATRVAGEPALELSARRLDRRVYRQPRCFIYAGICSCLGRNYPYQFRIREAFFQDGAPQK